MKILLAALIFLVSCAIEGEELVFEVAAPDHDLVNIPVYVDLPSTSYDENAGVCLRAADGVIPGQVEVISESVHRLWWIANQPAGSSETYFLVTNDKCAAEQYSWKEVKDDATQLVLEDRPVIQYEHPVFDPEDIETTKKPFHHVYNPAGNELLTKGLGGLWPHHRGIYFGYNHVYVDGDDTQIDIWHARNGERSEHSETLKELTGPVMGGHIVKIDWKDHEGVTFIEETREIRVYNQPDGESLIDFKSTLVALDKPVSLGGDRQHAGVQFRAAQDVVDNEESTRFIRPEDISHLPDNEEIGGEEMINLPWNAMYFEIDDRPYTVSYLSHPGNPNHAEMSERRYGRFGEFFPYELEAGEFLEVNYRFWIRAGNEPNVDDIVTRYKAYSEQSPVKIIQ